MFSFSFCVLIIWTCTLQQLFELGYGDPFNPNYVLSGLFGNYDAYVGSKYKYIGVRLEDAGAGLSWVDANSFCATEFGTELATIRSSDDNSQAYAALTGVFGYVSDGNDWAWIGISDIGDDGDGDFIWADGLGNSDDYTNWDDNYHPSTTRGSAAVCGEFHPDTDSEWYSYRCDDAATAFVCNRYNYYLTTEKDGYIGISTGYSSDAALYDEALGICTGVFGDSNVLASIHSGGENNAVSDVISVLNDLSASGYTLTTAWIGLTLTQDSHDDCVFAWEDGSDISFAEDDKWTGGCTTSYGTFDEIATISISRSTGEWSSLPEYWAKFVFMCNCDSDCQNDGSNGIYSQSVSDRETTLSASSVISSSSRTSGSYTSRSDSSSSSSNSGDDNNNNTILIVCVSVAAAVVLILTVIGFVYYRNKKKNTQLVTNINGDLLEMSKEKDYAPPTNDQVNIVPVVSDNHDQDGKVY